MPKEPMYSARVHDEIGLDFYPRVGFDFGEELAVKCVGGSEAAENPERIAWWPELAAAVRAAEIMRKFWKRPAVVVKAKEVTILSWEPMEDAQGQRVNF